MDRGLPLSLSAASLTFAVAAAAMSVRSQGTEDEYRRITGSNTYLFLLSDSGELAIKPIMRRTCPAKIWGWQRRPRSRSVTTATCCQWHTGRF